MTSTRLAVDAATSTETSPYFPSYTGGVDGARSPVRQSRSNRKRPILKVEYEPDPKPADVDLGVEIKKEEGVEDSSKVDVKVERFEPLDWRSQLEAIREMRKLQNAPVDTMGCDRCHDENATPQIKRFQILVSLMLSSQTKDEVTSAAMTRLRQRGLTPTSLLDASDEALGQLIFPVGFWRRKVGYLKKTAAILLESFGGDIPDSVEELCRLPGVGPKMAFLTMQVAWKRQDGIGVDTHVHRISNRLGWVEKPTKDPEQTRRALESWLPQEFWGEINALLVGFGQQVCLPVGPRCTECQVRNFCPFGKTNPGPKSPSKKKRSRSGVKEEPVVKTEII